MFSGTSVCRRAARSVRWRARPALRSATSARSNADEKEASSEILASVADALDTPISVIMREVGDRLAVLKEINPIPDTVPEDLVVDFDAEMLVR